MGNFVKGLIRNIRSCRLMDQKKGYFIYHCLNAEDVCFLLLKLYLDKSFYADFIEHFRDEWILHTPRAVLVTKI